MIFLKKILGSSAKTYKTDKLTEGSIERDAVKVDKLEVGQKDENNAGYNRSELSPITLQESQVNDVQLSENTMNVNQQVVVQFSNINGLQIGSTYNINNECTTDKEICKVNKVKDHRNKYHKTRTIEEMMKSQEELNSRFLIEIATHLGSNYKMFMRELGFSEGQISTMYLDHSAYGVREVIYQLLLDWERNTDGERTLGYLTTLLWNCGHRECVHKLKALWKSYMKNKT